MSKAQHFLCEIEFLVSGQPFPDMCSNHLVFSFCSKKSWSREAIKDVCSINWV